MKVGLYLHLPFCKAKCPYCDFYSETTPPEEELYLEALERELAGLSDFLERELKVSSLEIDTFYAGGGTPSLFSPSFFERLFQKLSQTFKFNPSELTLEANPESLIFEKARAYRELGFNRLSLGVQSFQRRGLKFLGRIHSPEEAERALEGVIKAGFKNISLDFIYGWRGQGLKLLERDLETALSYSITHLSFYELTLYPETPFYQTFQERPFNLNEKRLLKLRELVEGYLRERGFRHYEVSNFARPGFECRHNLKYWEVLPYLGIGAGAVSRVGRLRLKNPDNLKLYYKALLHEKRLPLEVLEELNQKELAKEYLFMGLRMIEGLLLSRLFEVGYTIKEEALNLLMERGLLERNPERIRLTQRGRLLHQAVVKLLWENLREVP